MKNKLMTINVMFLVGVASLFSMVGCEKRSTPPGPSSSFGIVEPNTYYQFLLWDEGLTILLLDNITKGHESHGSGSTKDPLYRQTGSAVSKDGYRYSWQVETADGKAAEIEIDGCSYAIGKGAVFLITVTGGGTTVNQVDLDLSQLSGIESCRAFVKANREALGIGDNSIEGR